MLARRLHAAVLTSKSNRIARHRLRASASNRLLTRRSHDDRVPLHSAELPAQLSTEIARDLDVDGLVEGTVLRSALRIRPFEAFHGRILFAGARI